MPQFSWIIGSEKESNPPLSPPVKIICVGITQSSSDIVMGEIELWGQGREVSHVSTRGALLYETSPYSEEQTVEEHCRIELSASSARSDDMFSVLWHGINVCPQIEADGAYIYVFIQMICKVLSFI